ncbi:peptidoglycan-binding domain-containing protein [Streptomyces sp. S.PB5]|uniref:peptidoglycan-binding domain-containing protein n=1 Tax=Streptomyces sp. S.PB5 TaxID=3020844 RepID=UPI0025B0E43F|nr:peptidoglycan-binding domain-containing protein [Streptomyces sp. S.PB5]MDN3020528.1 peptidoglycan-binding domain-containing protein [Streptomyces sp. S.PB5]
MADSSGHLCPECGAPRGADNTPSCGCTQRASDALRDARTAEAAAAEDFDPLRIRPYVELEGESAAPGSAPGAGAEAAPSGPRAAEETMPLRAVPAELPTPLAPSASAPSTTDLSLFDGAKPPDGDKPLDAHADSPRRRPRRMLLVGAAGGLAAVIAAAGLASGFFSYDTPTRDSALPEKARASVPDTTPSAASVSPSPSATSQRPTPTAPAAPPSTVPPVSPTPSPSVSKASPSASRSTAPSTAPATSAASATADGSAGSRESTPPVLSRGSSGEEVVELELRLTQLGLYTRKAGGHYNEAVEDAVTRYQWARGIPVEEYGVYDLVTRERLEAETQEP